jgi:rRNA-processing protein FCF1
MCLLTYCDICLADGEYFLWLVLDTNVLMASLDHLQDFDRQLHSKGSEGAYQHIDLNVIYFIPHTVVRELDGLKRAAGWSTGFT